MLWVEIVFVVCMYISIMPINNFTSDMLQVQFGLNSIEAGAKFGLIYFVSGFTLVFVGLSNDRYGQLGIVQVLSAVCSILANSWWSFYPT